MKKRKIILIVGAIVIARIVEKIIESCSIKAPKIYDTGEYYDHESES